MSRLADVQAFIAACGRAGSFDDLRALVGDMAREMRFDRFALIHHLDLGDWRRRRSVALSDYPDSWIESYVKQKLVGADPTLAASQRTNVGFRWADIPKLVPLTSIQKRVLEETRVSGLIDGFTVPANIPGEANGSCHFAIEQGSALPEQNLPMAQVVGAFAFQAARDLVIKESGLRGMQQRPRLTPRQLECLVWIARGKTDWEIGRILGVSEETVSEHLDEARRRYGVTRRIELAMEAAFSGELPLIECVQARSTPA